MRDYTYTYLKDLALPMETVRLIGRINEYKGKQDFYKQQAPQSSTPCAMSPSSSRRKPRMRSKESSSRRSSPNHYVEVSRPCRSFRGRDCWLPGCPQPDPCLSRGHPGQCNILLQLHKELYKFVPIEGGGGRTSITKSARRSRMARAVHASPQFLRSRHRQRCRRFATAFVSAGNKRTSTRSS